VESGREAAFQFRGKERAPVVELGYALSSEEFPPNDLVELAVRAEETGFSFALISDHFHPWVSRQGHSPFVWSVLGGIAQRTTRLRLGTGVTCPIIRTHPAIIAQAAATAAAMMPGRFFLGVGTGENLNEHILGDRWPPIELRQGMLTEAIEVIRQLWQGGPQTHYGDYFVIEDAQIFTLPDELPPIYVAASGPSSGELAGEIGDGLISTAPDKKIVEAFEGANGAGKAKYGQITVCWAKDEAAARKTALEIWPISGMPGPLNQELATPQHFEQVAADVTEDDVAKQVVCGPDPQPYLEKIKSYVEAGFDHIYLHQIGPDQEGFFEFSRQAILPAFTAVA
jgi:coenzyme F420-dependent glucose-6-phosphate dehydrogenase